MSPEEYFRNGWKEYLIHLPEDTEHPIEVLVLRGHILIERQIAKLIKIVLPNPSALDLEQMRFSAKVKLAQSLVGREARPWLWESLKKANKLRNSLAHKLDYLEAEKLARAVIDMAQKDDTLTFQMVAGKSLEEQLAYSMGWIHERLLNECANRTQV
jgi:hypothetical protein